MSKSKVPLILETKVSLPNGDKVAKAAKACPQTAVRRKLADISNLPQNSRPFIQDEKPQCNPTTAKEHIEQLQKENIDLVKMLAQRNKIIEQSGLQLEKMKVNLLKVQEQNRQLALANTQILTDLNSGKDKLKTLQHELGCKNILLNLRKLELKEKVETTNNLGADAEIKPTNTLGEGEPTEECKEVEKPRTTKRKIRQHGLDSSQRSQLEENPTNKRPLTRRRSAMFKAAAESEGSEESHVPNDPKPSQRPSPDNPIPEDTPSTSNASIEIETEESKRSSSVDCETQGSRRLSASRPSRMAVMKVQSYKEIPLNTKMRRPE